MGVDSLACTHSLFWRRISDHYQVVQYGAVGAAEQDRRFKRLICRQSNMLGRSRAKVR